MNILWVKTAGLYPPDTGGRIRSYNILRHLANHHSVTLFTFYAAQEGDRNPELRNFFDRVICVPMALPKPKSTGEMFEYLRHSMSLQPYNITKYCRPFVRKELMNVLHETHYDVIVCDFVFAAGTIPWDWPCAKVLFAHNVEAQIWRRHYDTARHLLWKLLCWREWRTMLAAEFRYLKKANHVLTVSNADRDFFLKFLPQDKLTVVPTGVDTDFFRPSGEPEKPSSIVFVGSMDWLPNEDAVVHFLENILPLVRRDIPDVWLTVVGRYPSQRLKALAQREDGVRLTGWVPDVRPFVSEAAVCIVPLRIGGGTRIKIFEAMAMGKAVLSTTLGAEGLPVCDKDNIVIADEPAAFAQALTSLLRDAAARRRLGDRAHRFVAENYSWANAGNVVSSVLEDVAGKPDWQDRRVTIRSAASNVEPPG
jgi:sugar transferase (PEP-CTERM/EpsH1 system associated)